MVLIRIRSYFLFCMEGVAMHCVSVCASVCVCACARMCVQFKMVSMRLEKSILSLGSFPKVAFETVCLIDSCPLSSFQGRSCSASFFHASLFEATNGVMSLALCLWVVSQASQHFRSSEEQTTWGAFVLPARLSAWSFPFTLACPGQDTHRSFRRWLLTIDTFQSGLPMPPFVASSLMMSCVVWLSPLEAIQWRIWVTASASIVKLDFETVQAALSSWMVVTPCLTVKPHPDWCVCVCVVVVVVIII